MNVTLLLQSFLIGLLCYLGAVDTPWAFGVTGGYYILGRPLVAGLLIGLIFGDVTTGILCGVAVQGVFIASMHTGGTSSSEITYAAYGGIGLAMATTGEPVVAVTLALLIGQTFGLLFYNAKMVGFSFFNRKAENAAKAGNERGLVMHQIVWPQIVNFIIRVFPVMAAIYYGQGAVDALFNVMPDIVNNIISALGGILPALGIGMLMNILIGEKKEIIYFLFGFVMIAFLDINIIGLVFIAALIAYLVYEISGRSNGDGSDNSGNEMIEDDGVYEDSNMFG